MRYVKFSPEEMAYDAPPDTSDPNKFPTIGWGPKDWKKFVKFRNGFVRIDPAVRKAFSDEKAINGALRKVIEMQELTGRPRRKVIARKSA